MVDKRNTSASWRKGFSGFLSRQTPAKSKLKSQDASEVQSIATQPEEESQTAAPENALDFKLDVDLSTLGTSDLSAGWLETRAPEAKKEPTERKEPAPEAPDNTRTPIAELFKSRSVLDLSLSLPGSKVDTPTPDANGVQPRPISVIEPAISFNPSDDVSSVRSSLFTGSILERGRPVESKHFMTEKAILDPSNPEYRSRSRAQVPSRNGTPVSMVERSITPRHVSDDVSSIFGAQSTGSILDRGRPVEPKHYDLDTPRRTEDSRLRASSRRSSIIVNEPAPLRDSPPKPPLSSGKYSAPIPRPPTSELMPPPKRNSTDRHSMYAATNPSPAPAVIERRPAPMRSVSSNPADRIKAWQKTVTSAPSAAAAPGSPASPAPGAQSTIPTRRPSARGVTSDRLAWIRELEGKKASGVNRDLGMFKKQGASVSDKLAMFEQKQTPETRLSPPTRSNSTTSRLSWAAMDSTASTQANATAATPRTSIDTVRSSHRASSVMSHYDDSFREKMETIAGANANDQSKPDTDNKVDGQVKSDAQAETEAPKKQVITSQFVPVKAEKKEEVQSGQKADEVSPSPAPEKEVQVEQKTGDVEANQATEEKVQIDETVDAKAEVDQTPVKEVQSNAKADNEVESNPENKEKSDNAEVNQKIEDQKTLGISEAGPSEVKLDASEEVLPTSSEAATAVAEDTKA